MQGDKQITLEELLLGLDKVDVFLTVKVFRFGFTSIEIKLSLYDSVLQVRRYSVSVPPLHQPLSPARHQRPRQALPMSDMRSQIHTHSKPEAAHAHTLRYVKWGKCNLQIELSFENGSGTI